MGNARVRNNLSQRINNDMEKNIVCNFSFKNKEAIYCLLNEMRGFATIEL